jgi:hypothetical protein
MPRTGEQVGQAGQEIATLKDGRTVCVLFDGYTLPAEQPAPIKTSITVLPSPLPKELRDEIREASPHSRLIGSRMQERIRARYSQEDELKFSRIGTGQALNLYTMSEAEQAAIGQFGLYLEECREWARAERAKLGL